MGGVHRFGPDHNGQYSTSVLWAWRDRFAAIPRRAEHDPYWPGRHAGHDSRAFAVVSSTYDRVRDMGIFG